MIQSTLKGVKDHLSVLLIFSIVGGLLLGYHYDVTFLKQTTGYILFLMVYPMMINLNAMDVLKAFRSFRPIGTSLVLNFVLSPLWMLLVIKVFHIQSPEMILGFVLIALLPTSGMTAGWTGLAKGDLTLSLVVMSTNLIASVFYLPLVLPLVLGNQIPIEQTTLVYSLVKVVIVPLLLGDLTRRFLISKKGAAAYKGLKPLFSGASSVGVLAIVFVAMALKAKQILADPMVVLWLMAPILVYYIGLMVVSEIVGRRLCGHEQRIALVYAVGLRNLTIALGLLLSVGGASAGVLVVAVSYLLQLPLAAGYRQMVLQTAS